MEKSKCGIRCSTGFQPVPSPDRKMHGLKTRATENQMTVIADKKSDLLLDPAFMARLDQLDLLSRKLLAGKLKGERRSKRRGQSVEFADYRNYVVGDDLRFIDWNIYGRLDRLFLKLFMEEEDLSLYILVDVSKSCDYGNPNKALYLKRVAAALGYIGLVNYNRVNIVAMSSGIVAETGAARQAANRADDRFCRASSSRRANRISPLRASDSRWRIGKRACCVVLSDFYIKDGFEAGLKYLAGGKYDLFAVQMPQPAGDRAGFAGRLEAQRYRRQRYRGGVDHAAADEAIQVEPERVLPGAEGLRHPPRRNVPVHQHRGAV